MAKKKSYRKKSARRSSDEIKLTDYLAVAPGLLMVGMILLILILDVTTPSMAEYQYYSFHIIFKAFDYTAIILGAILLITKATKHELHFELRDLFFTGFMICIIISTCINGFSKESAFGLAFRYIGIFNMLAFLIVYLQASGYIERIQFRYAILLGYLFVADAIALSVLYDKYISAIPAYQNKLGVSALFVNSNHYGYFLTMAILIGIGLFIYESDKRLVGIGAVSGLINVGILGMNMTMGAVLAVIICMVGLFIVILLKERDRIRRFLIMIGVITAAAIIMLAVSPFVREEVFGLIHDMGSILTGNATGEEGSGRMTQWSTVIGYIKEKPWFGHGCEGITMRLLEATGVGDAHCEPMTFAAYYGIPGMILYLSGIIATVVAYFKQRSQLPAYCKIAFLAACGYFVSSLVGVPMFNTTPFFYILMGMSGISYRNPGMYVISKKVR